MNIAERGCLLSGDPGREVRASSPRLGDLISTSVFPSKEHSRVDKGSLGSLPVGLAPGLHQGRISEPTLACSLEVRCCPLLDTGHPCRLPVIPATSSAPEMRWEVTVRTRGPSSVHHTCLILYFTLPHQGSECLSCREVGMKEPRPRRESFVSEWL